MLILLTFFYLLKNYRKLVETLFFIRDFYKRIKWKNILFWEKSPAIYSWKFWIHWKSEDNIFVSLNKTELVKWRTSHFYLCELSTDDWWLVWWSSCFSFYTCFIGLEPGLKFQILTWKALDKWATSHIHFLAVGCLLRLKLPASILWIY